MLGICVIAIWTCLAASLHAANLALIKELDTKPVVHFELFRRGGPFSSVDFLTDVTNLTYLSIQQAKTEARFGLTTREVHGNKLVRKAKANTSGGKQKTLSAGEVASDGIWYIRLNIGEPKPQEIELDINMLVADFVILTTTSETGSKYEDFFSTSKEHGDEKPLPGCTIPTEVFHFPILNVSSRLSFTHCKPRKASTETLGPSGSTLGLAPSDELSQTGAPSIFKQLLEKDIIQRSIFSIMLINGHEGVLSVGGTAAAAVDHVTAEMERGLNELHSAEQQQVPPEITKGPSQEEQTPPESTGLAKRSRRMKGITGRDDEWDHGWTWNKVQGADGWWQVLMQAVWIDGSKVLQNRAAIIDLNSPFILAPPLAAKIFYSSVSGSFRLPPPHDRFHAFPCLNPPKIAFEFNGHRFPLMHSAQGSFGNWEGLPGGLFSLGRWKEGSGYCIGAVAETRVGLRDDMDELVSDSRQGNRINTDQQTLGGNGMRDTWIIGGGFFHGLGAAFDFKEQRVGFRRY